MRGYLGNKQRLEHALEAITEIESYLNGQDFSQFLGSSMMRFACIKQLEIIGEACNYLTDSFKTTYPEVEWRRIIGLRHILVHEYFGVDTALVWDVLTHDLPILKHQIALILEQIE